MPRSFGPDRIANNLLHPGDVLIADLQARAAWHADVNDKLSRVGARKVGTCQGTEREPG